MLAPGIKSPHSDADSDSVFGRSANSDKDSSFGSVYTESTVVSVVSVMLVLESAAEADWRYFLRGRQRLWRGFISLSFISTFSCHHSLSNTDTKLE